VEILPKYIQERIPRGEKDFREALNRQLSDSPTIVLHSVGSTEHLRKSYTEVDFVLITDQGIACLEVKGGEVIRRKDGNWEIGYQDTNNYYVSHEGPFKQSMSTVPAVLQELRRSDKKIKFPVVWGVVFPHCRFLEKDTEWSDYHICDMSKLNNFNTYLDELFKKSLLSFESKSISYPNPNFIISDDLIAAKTILRKDFEITWFSGNQVAQSKREVCELEETQASYLDEMILGENSRMILRGGAGTGKTLLATKAANYFAENSQKTLFLTFNSMLSNELKSFFSNSLIEVVTINEFMLKLCGIKPPSHNLNKFFQDELPYQFADAVKSLEEDGELELFDVLIIDEAQDFLSETVLISLFDLLKGGHQGGKWLICIDQDVQAGVYGNYSRNLIDFIGESLNCEQRSLFRNLRNPKQIAEKANSLFPDLKMPIPARIFSTPPKFQTYANDKHLLKKIISVSADLIAEGVRPEEITVLTFKSKKSSVLSYQKFLKDVPIVHYSEKVSGAISWSQIGAFKGLENEVIILIEIDEDNFELRKSEYFVGITRARTELFILCAPKSRVLEM